MNAKEILEELRPLGRESYKSVLLKHGVQEPCWGVKIEELKKIQKRIKHDYALSLELFDTGIHDVMYLAGLIANDARMTRANLQHWLDKGGPGRTHTIDLSLISQALRRGWGDPERLHPSLPAGTMQ